MRDSSFAVEVIGEVRTSFRVVQPKRLSPASRQLLALLVAAGPSGIAATDLARERGATPSEQAIRMATVRLRKHLPDHVFPRADDGIYRLDLQPIDVDAWRLEEVATAPGEDYDLAELRHLLRSATPYEGVPASERLDESERRLRRLQREVFVKLADVHPAAITGHLLDALISHSQDDLLNEPLLLGAASALTNAGRRTEAIKLIGRAHAAFGETGLELGNQVRAFERELLDGAQSVVVRQPLADRPRSHVPSQLRTRLTGLYAGPRSELAHVREVMELTHDGLDAIVLSGPSGAGKTRLSAEVAAIAVEAAWNVVFIAPSTLTSQAPFGPLSAAMPELGNDVSEIIGSSADADSVKVALWNTATSALAERSKVAPLLLIVDDGQWLDDATAEFLLHYASTSVPGRVLMLLNGRSDVAQSSRWSELHDRLEALGAVHISIAPLDAEGIRAFVDDQRPGMNGALLTSVSDELHEASAGLPGIAGPLLAAMPVGSAVLPAVRDLSARAPLGPAIDSLSDVARAVGVAAAVIGPRFRFDGLEAVAPLEQDELLAGLEELLDRGLVIDKSLVDFEIAHALVERGLIGMATRSELAQTHLLAADFHRDDVHRRAHHLWSALPVSALDDAVDALTTSALISLRGRSYRRAIRQFEAVRQLKPGALTPGELGRYARALDLSGMRESALARRQEGFELAANDCDWTTALDIALSGLPEVEPLDGDAALLDNLIRIDGAPLSDHDSWRRSTTAARQLTIFGKQADALEFADESERWASTPAERVGSALTQRFAMSTLTAPARRLAVMHSVAHEMDLVGDGLRGDYLLNLAIDQHQTGDADGALDTIVQLEHVEARSAVKVWHGRMTRAMLHSDSGQLALSTTLRNDAHSFAVSAGLAEADTALLAAMFVEVWLAGNANLFVEEVDGGILDPSRRHLTKAGAAAVLFECGDPERAAVLAIESAEAELSRPNPQTLPVLALVSAPLAHSGDVALIDRVQQAFSGVGNSMVVVGAGAANLGPVGRYQARLCRTADERFRRLADALDLADRSGALLWRAVVRRDLVEAGRTEFADEFHELVRSTELERLLTGREAASAAN